MIKRKSPKGKKASLFVTCMVDMMYPETGVSVVEVLAHLGVEVDFPQGQTCCGQPAFNSGYWDDAKTVARHFIKAFRHAELIVVPSGSCCAMVRHEYPRLFEDEPALKAEAERLSSITWEITEFIVDGLGVTDLNGRLPHPQKIVCHHACHGLRVLGLGKGAETLLDTMENADHQTWDNGEICCGFGGLFSVKMADVSNAMLEKKLDHIALSGADCVVTGDVSCMTHINGGLEKRGKRPLVRHIADVLADGIRGEEA